MKQFKSNLKTNQYIKNNKKKQLQQQKKKKAETSNIPSMSIKKIVSALPKSIQL